jgi:hypothetical protein
MYTEVATDMINLRDDQFHISFMADRRRLIESIRHIGLLHPVVLRSTPSPDQYQIVSGFQRVKSCRDLNFSRINSLVYGQDELPDSRAILLTVHQTVTSRPLNLVEKSLTLRKLTSLGRLSEAEVTTNIMPFLALEPHLKIFRSVSGLWNLTDTLKTYIVQNDVALSNAIMFLNFNQKDQQDLYRLIAPLKLGTNRLRELLIMIDEICRRDDISVRSIIDEEIRSILSKPDMPTPQKSEAIRGRLKRKRFPKIVSLENEVQEKLKKLKLPPTVTLTTPPFLEGDRLKVHCEFKNADEFNKIIQKLSEISNDDAFTSLLDML